MDKIWYRNPSKSEVIGHCGGEEKTEWPSITDKSRTLNKIMSLIIQHTELEEPCEMWKNDLTYINITNICLRGGGEASDKPITHVYCINVHVQSRGNEKS